MNDEKYRVIFVIGAPGAGKNTQCDHLISKYKFVHFSAGDLLRAEAKKDTEEGKTLREIMNEGKLVPSQITCGLLKKNMDLSEGGRKNIFIIDGYPRNLGNIDAWNEVFGDSQKILCVLYLDCALEACFERLLKRSESSNRTDDQKEVIEKRFNTFLKENDPVVGSLEKVTTIIKIDSSLEENEVLSNICIQIEDTLRKNENLELNSINNII